MITGRPAAAAGLRRRATEIVVVAGHRVAARTTIAHTINATNGRPFTIVVNRDGKRVVVGPLKARLDQGAYRVGFQIRGKNGPGSRCRRRRGSRCGSSAA